ncbi:MAG: substrate-binding domain-containing protein, partial [Euryarchaeota archaeon]|nr:substrate-binding domain-containing protein [Euryarchaeota archaeon]
MERIEAVRKLIYFVSLVILLAAALTACQAKPVNPAIILATTTSTQDSGLLDALVPIFEQESGYIVKTVAVGTGQALKMGEEGNADILLVHSPKAEEAFMQAGFGLERHLVMHNDFVLVGPAADPAGIRSAASTTQALIQIANAAAPFVSRGDDSGTHKMERSLWEAAGSPPLGGWYIESGQGMGATLRIASEKQAYTLTDRATYLANRATLQLDVLLEGDPSLLNIYHVIVVNPEKWPQV